MRPSRTRLHQRTMRDCLMDRAAARTDTSPMRACRRSRTPSHTRTDEADADIYQPRQGVVYDQEATTQEV